MENNSQSNNQEPKTEQKEPRKCFCARCFLPIDPDDRVEIECQNFHKICGMCCVCRQTPRSLKSFYGHVFCSDCFKTHVLNRFRGADASAHCDTWWMQWGPRGYDAQDGAQAAANEKKYDEPEQGKGSKEETATPESGSQKKCFCARCLHAIPDKEKVEIGGQTFHAQCACCCCCHTVPTTKLKIFYGQVFCEECFQRYNVLSQRGDKEFNPDSMRFYFDQWHNPSFVEHMKEFMNKSEGKPPTVYLMPGGQPSFCSLGPQVTEWRTSSDNNKSATARPDDCDLSFEERTEAESNTDPPTSRPQSPNDAFEKIENLTKLLQETVELNRKSNKKWKIFDSSMADGGNGVTFARETGLKSDCLWQCGIIYV